jgi:hypothetical protein
LDQFSGKIILLATIGDEDAFSAFPKCKAMFPKAISHVFIDSGGHHYIFLLPEMYTKTLTSLLSNTDT